MPVYAYVGRDALGRRRAGKVEAATAEAARGLLFARGIVTVEKIKEKKSLFEGGLNISFLTRVKLRDLLVFTRQLRSMVSAGVPLVRGLRIVADQMPNKGFARIILDVASAVEHGDSFSRALNRYRRVFGDLYISMVRAGEEGGMLDQVLAKLSEHLEKTAKLKGKIKSAMSYPAFVLVLAIVIVIALFVYVVPMFQKFYEEAGVELPGPTQFVIDIGNWMKAHIGLFLAGLAGFVFALSQIRRIPPVKAVLDRVFLRMPLFGDLILKASMANFAGTLSAIIASGVSITTALDVAGQTATNSVVRSAISKVREQVERGVSIATAMAKDPIFPAMVVSMVSIGEEAGNLDEMLSKVADFYEEEVDRTVDALTSMLEPLMVAFIGLTVGGIVGVLYLPVFKLGETVGG
jgi:type IV pilus assembly protein PilC